MITDQRVLQDRFIPREVVHRDAEIQAIADNLEPITDGQSGHHTLVHGPTGAGKTCIVQHTLDQLEDEVPELQYQYVNCWEHYTRFQVLYQALNGIGRTLDIHRQSTPTDVLFSRIQEQDDRPYVLVLDEVDQVEDAEVLYDLYTMEHITLVMVANRPENVFYEMEDRIRSRMMTSTQIAFPAYGTDDLVDILQDRSDWGLRPDSIDAGGLRRIAAAADGDARIAISTLRNAAQYAEHHDLDRITDEAIDEAVPMAEQETRQASVDQLNPHQKALYDIIRDAEEIQSRELYDRYEEDVDEPRSERMRRKYLNKLEHYNLITVNGSGRWRTYKPVNGDAAE